MGTVHLPMGNIFYLPVESPLMQFLRPGLANHLRNMSHLEFMQVLRPIYHKLLNAVEGIQAQVVAIGELMEDLQNS